MLLNHSAILGMVDVNATVETLKDQLINLLERATTDIFTALELKK